MTTIETGADVQRGIRRIAELSRADVLFAGGKGANLGELTAAGFPVPQGFVVGAPIYAAFVTRTGLRRRIEERLAGLDVDDSAALELAARDTRRLVEAEPMPADIAEAIRLHYAEVAGDDPSAPVAVRSSATAEDTEAASFAGMNETFLNTRGADGVVEAVHHCWASLFGARTIFYRAKRGFGQADMDIAVVVEAQIASERAGVMFTIDPASGADDRLVIEGSFGLGESVVSGHVSPDRFVVDKESLGILVREIHPKEATIEPLAEGGTAERPLSRDEGLRPTLSDDEVRAIADLGRSIERHYGTPQDTEWAIDAAGTIWMLQSRPVTSSGGTETPAAATTGRVLVRGLGAAPGRAGGKVAMLGTIADAAKFQDGDVLVTRMTAPDWVPLMRRACAIATDSGGMTCHAAIVSRELGIPCVVGTQQATTVLHDGDLVTVDATRGIVLEGLQAAPAVEHETVHVVTNAAPITATKLLLNLSEPSQVARASELAVDGVGLLRAELMLLEALEGKHPRLLLEQGRSEEFVDRMAEGLTTFAAGFAPRPVTYRTTDFRTNEFRNLEGGDRFEPEEANPMIGVRGALRYARDPEIFRVELDAIRRVWDAGLQNLHVMLPFVRTTTELARCKALIGESGLLDRPGFELWVMAEVPSVLFNLEAYAELGVAGISIGSNDLTQLLLGADRDSEYLAELFDERDPAVVAYLEALIPKARALGLKTSICGQAPSVHPEYTELLVRAGIDAISVNIDVVDRTRRLVASAEQRVILEAARSRCYP
ncbi:MAG: phosphoenolpyruvate synthase [Actinomycetes bacterium]